MKGSKKPGQNKRSFSEWASERFDIPGDLFPGNGTLELRGRTTLTLRGCQGILKYTKEEMRFQMNHEILVVTGKRLICTSYLTGAVIIDGFIEAIRFEEAKE